MKHAAVRCTASLSLLAVAALLGAVAVGRAAIAVGGVAVVALLEPRVG